MMNILQENKLEAYPMVEVYEKDVVHFLAPLDHQEEFFVPETKQGDLAEHKEQ